MVRKMSMIALASFVPVFFLFLSFSWYSINIVSSSGEEEEEVEVINT